MKKKDLKYLNSIENINDGGCGIAALSIKRKKKRGSIIKAMSGIFSEKLHYYVVDGEKVIDSTGVYSKKELDGYWKTEKVSEKELVKNIKNESLWNQIFNRKNIKKIEKDLGVDLSDIT